MTRRVVICAAVSTKDKQQDPESQVRALQARCDLKGYVVVETLRFKQSRWDADSEREVQSAALLPIQEGRADLLLVWSWDRIGRGKADAAFRFINRLEKEMGAGFESVQEPFLSTAGSDPAMRELLLPIIAWVANRESTHKSERLKLKVESKKAAVAKLPGNQRAAWGRGKMPTDNDRRLIHDGKARGLTQRAIAAEVGLSLGTVNRVLKQARPDGVAVPRLADEQAGATTEPEAPAEGGGLEHRAESAGVVAGVQPSEPVEPVGGLVVAGGSKA